MGVPIRLLECVRSVLSENADPDVSTIFDSMDKYTLESGPHPTRPGVSGETIKTHLTFPFKIILKGGKVTLYLGHDSAFSSVTGAANTIYHEGMHVASRRPSPAGHNSDDPRRFQDGIYSGTREFLKNPNVVKGLQACKTKSCE